MDAPLTARLVVLRVSLPVLKRVMNVVTLAEMMWSPPRVPADEHTRAQCLARIRFVMATGGWLIIGSNCLERSLALYRVLSRANAEPTLVLGARREGASLAGHAWIELGGQALREPDAGTYVKVMSFDPHGCAHHSPDLAVPA